MKKKEEMNGMKRKVWDKLKREKGEMNGMKREEKGEGGGDEWDEEGSLEIC